jgi:dihydrofolate reductase
MRLADRMIVTHIDHTYRCDTFFPPIDPALWRAVAREEHRSDAAGVAFSFVTYEKT